MIDTKYDPHHECWSRIEPLIRVGLATEMCRLRALRSLVVAEGCEGTPRWTHLTQAINDVEKALTQFNDADKEEKCRMRHKNEEV